MFHVKQFEKLEAFARDNQIPFGEQEQKQFESLCSLLIEENKVMNLTAIETPEEIETLHFVDSLEAVPLLCDLWAKHIFEFPTTLSPHDAVFRLIDVGTGAGFPGIPLKIAFPNAEFVLADSLNKRIGFIEKVIENLELSGIFAIASRAEDLGKEGSVSRETFDFCVSRAVASLPVLLEYCLPLVKVNGYCILYKSGDYQDELQLAEAAMEVLGGKLVDVQEFTLPDTDIQRSLLVIRKIKTTPAKYPRRPGKPSKSPIR
ncbi:MAG: 16S rRNA (guanine(527)-N(7))-methyltransferase RsmG [Lachnospiraceae bacterium]|nr:16S rRNA (guanine(527)-N(7))-methyltransferase RsmG [Lachnospiraceae bacterium]